MRATANSAYAEIIPTIKPTWHVALTIEGHELAAARALALRRFGLYLPLEDTWRKTDELDRQAPLFPGYVFLFVWGLSEHASRIRACNAIVGFLHNSEGVPVTVPDRIIAEIEEIEWSTYLSHLPRSFFRRRRHQAIEIHRWRSPNHGFADPNPENRIFALQKALGVT